MRLGLTSAHGVIFFRHCKILSYGEGRAMDCREFLKQGLTASAGLALAGMPKLAGWAYADDPTKWRTFEVTTVIEIKDPLGGVRAWVPVPLTANTDYFKREPDIWAGNFKSARVVQYDKYGTGIVFA